MKNSLQFTVTTFNTRCGYKTGGIGVIVTNGVPPYQYKINSGNYWMDNGLFGNLLAGHHRIYVMDATGLVDSTDVIIDNTYPSLVLTPLTNNANVLFCDDTYQNYTLIASGGTPPYLFTNDFVNMQSGNVFNNLTKGDYNWAVKDANGCVAMLSTSIGSNNCLFGYSGGGSQNTCDTNLTADLRAVHFAANSVNNCLVSANGGPYHDIAFAYGAGLHVFDIIDTATGANTKYVKSVLNYCKLELAALIKKADCLGDNGAVTLKAKNGMPPFLFSDDGFDFYTLDSFSNLRAGIYTFAVKDAEENVAFTQVEIFADCPVIAANVIPTNCGASNGIIDITGYGGVLPYSYSINGLDFQDNNEFKNLALGNYTITLKDAEGFKDSTVVSVFNGACLSVELITSSGNCGNTGSITVSASGGLVPISYSLDSINFQSSNIFTNLSEGNYTIYVKDGYGIIVKVQDTISPRYIPKFSLGRDTFLCQGEIFTITPDTLYVGSNIDWSTGENSSTISISTSGNYWSKVTNLQGCVWIDTIFINVKNLPLFNLGNDTSICENDSLLLDAMFSNAEGYLWNDNSTNPKKSIKSPGLYWCETIREGCTYRDSINLRVNPYPVINLGVDTSLCEGSELQLNVFNEGANYIWQDNSVLNTYSVRQEGTYTVLVDKNGCVISDTINVELLMKPRFTLGEDQVICNGQRTILKPIIDSSWNLVWQDGSSNPTYLVDKEGRYSLTANNVCGTAKEDVLFVKGQCKVYVPNAFTPNGDRRNDVFKISGTELLSYFHLQIYNRYGQLVFESMDKNRGWDGLIKSLPAESGTYVYVLKYNENMKKTHLKGSFVLIK